MAYDHGSEREKDRDREGVCVCGAYDHGSEREKKTETERERVCVACDHSSEQSGTLSLPSVCALCVRMRAVREYVRLLPGCLCLCLCLCVSVRLCACACMRAVREYVRDTTS